MTSTPAPAPTPTPYNSNEIIEDQLRKRLLKVEALMGLDALMYSGPISDIAHDLIKIAIEDHPPRRDGIAILLETDGGFIEVAERIATTIRHHYKVVDFVVTSFAMSAGTVLVMSGDNIYMDYSATLGPIDPQVQQIDTERFVPALGYLEQYNRLVQKSANGTLTPAELVYLCDNFDPAELYQYEQARDLSTALLREWLVKYKFKNWTTTETRKRSVTPAMRQRRAGRIAGQLNDTQRWHSHSRGIHMATLRADLKLLIEDVADTPDLHRALTDYHSLVLDYRNRRGHDVLVLNWTQEGGYRGY